MNELGDQLSRLSFVDAFVRELEALPPKPTLFTDPVPEHWYTTLEGFLDRGEDVESKIHLNPEYTVYLDVYTSVYTSHQERNDELIYDMEDLKYRTIQVERNDQIAMVSIRFYRSCSITM
jgi:hypothetical protein